MAQIMTYTEARDRTLIEEMRRNPKIFFISFYGSSVPAFRKQVDEFGWDKGRYCFSGISETQTTGAGIGAALAGMRPIVYLMHSDFPLDSWGQIVLAAAKMRFKLGYKVDCPVVYHMEFGNYDNGSSVHHTGCYHNWLANSPGLQVVIPSTAADAVGLWRTALRETKDPVVMMQAFPLASIKGPVPEGDFVIPFGRADIKREGTDVTIAAVGYMVNLALAAAEDLANQGIKAEVWDPRTLTPLDRESLLASVKKTGSLVVVDQAPKSFGTTGEFTATIAESLTPVPPMARVATMDLPIGFSPTLETYVLPNKDKIIKAVKDVVARKRG